MREFAGFIRKTILVLVLLALGIGAERSGLVAYLCDPFEYPYIISLLGQHMAIVLWSMLIATLIGIAAGIILTRSRMKKYAGVCMYIISLGQTIPSLAILALAMSFMGVGTKPAVFALTIYSVLPIARNTLEGISAVPNSLLDAARGMGMPAWRILCEVEIPNAVSIILTGFRIALVINVGTVALAYLIGAGGMGDLIFTGIETWKTEKLLAGAIPVTLIALLADYLCEVLGILLVPRGLRINGK